ncbi:hypothetical protein GCM10027566_00560 [Arachidicoccus ginsenosidivorans]|jgi:hypothetical protein
MKKLPKGTPTLLISHFPVLATTTQVLIGDGHSERKKLKTFFTKKNKVKVRLSGHNHLSVAMIVAFFMEACY